VIISIDGMQISRWNRLAETIGASEGKTLKISFNRDGIRQDVTAKPKLQKSKNIFGEEVDSYKLGISPAPGTVIERMNPLEAGWASLKQTWLISRLTLLSLVKIVEGVVSPKTLGGPILIAQMAGTQAREGLIPFILFMALLSINLAILNLLPVPVLDGGHLLFYLIEIVKGSEVSIKWREMANQVGFVLLIILMIFVFMMDIDRLSRRSMNLRNFSPASKTLRKKFRMLRCAASFVTAAYVRVRLVPLDLRALSADFLRSRRFRIIF
jgi:regulator of sigma E protease